MPEIVEQLVESSEPERLATGFEFTEGPVWSVDGGYWLFVDIRRSLIFRMAPGGEPEIFRENSNGSNGLTFDLQGRLIMCEGDGRRLTRMEPDGTITPIAERSDGLTSGAAGGIEGKRLNRPNDVVVRSDGSVYFTNPSGRIEESERELDFAGVHRIDPDGSVTAVTGDLRFPNGIAFSPDERVLYVAITRRDDACIQAKERGEAGTHQLIRAFDVAADGSLSNERVFANMFSASDGVPDGMKVDSKGRVFCTGPEGCWVFDSAGNPLGIIRLPEIPANCAWGGPDHRTMLFTARTSVYSLRMKDPGVRLPRASQ